MKVLRLSGKVSDLVNYEVLDENGNTLFESEGDNPLGGDYIHLEIDIDTGQIKNWSPDRVRSHIQEQQEK